MSRPKRLRPLTAIEEGSLIAKRKDPTRLFRDIAAELKISKEAAQGGYRRALKKIDQGIPDPFPAAETKELERNIKLGTLRAENARVEDKIRADKKLMEAGFLPFMKEPTSSALEGLSEKDQVELWKGVETRILQSISFDDVLKSSLYQKMTSAGIAFDKRRLLEGRSTQNISIQQRVTLSVMLGKLKEEIERRHLVEVTDPVTGVTTVEEA